MSPSPVPDMSRVVLALVALTAVALPLVALLAVRAQVRAADNQRRADAEHAELESARESIRRKSELLAVVSHEFRTPLTAIVGYAELLHAEVAGPLTAQQRYQLARIRAGAGHLQGLIESLLSSACIESGREGIRADEVDLRALIDESEALVQPALRAKGLHLAVELRPNAGSVTTDKAKLRQILVNLLSNAVKFTERGIVRVRAGVDDEWLVIDVNDTGIGIPPAALPHVFEPFWRSEDSQDRGGSGLGLSVSRHLAQVLGGTIDARSRPGVGSTFTLRVPRRISATRAA